jgi:transposase
MGTKRSVLVDARGVPLSLAVSGANTHDTKLLKETLESASHITPSGEVAHLCLDAGYKGMEQIVEEACMVPHIKPRNEEKREGKAGKKPRRWVVERIFSWLNKFKKLLVRFEKLKVSHMGLLQFCCAAIAFRQIITIYG